MTGFFGAEVDDSKVLDVLDRIVSVGGDTEPAMMRIAGYMENQVRLGFKQSRSPYGEVWEPVQRSGQPLIDNRTLLSSINSAYGADFAEVGTNVEYAAIHQFGGQAGRNKAVKITARPYLPIDNDEVVLPPHWENEILGILNNVLEGLTSG